MQWEIRQGSDVSVPFEEDDVVRMLEQGQLTAETLVRPVGKSAWKPATKHAPFAMALRRAMPPSASAFAEQQRPQPPPRDPSRWDQQTAIDLPVPPLARVTAAQGAGRGAIVPAPAGTAFAPGHLAPTSAVPPGWIKAGVAGVWVLVVGLAAAASVLWRKADQDQRALLARIDAQASDLRSGQGEALADAREARAVRKLSLADVPNVCHGMNDHATCTITNDTDAPITVCFGGKIAQKEAMGVTLLSMTGCTGRLDPDSSKTVSVPWVQGQAEDICNSKSVFGHRRLDWERCSFVAR